VSGVGVPGVVWSGPTVVPPVGVAGLGGNRLPMLLARRVLIEIKSSRPGRRCGCAGGCGPWRRCRRLAVHHTAVLSKRFLVASVDHQFLPRLPNSPQCTNPSCSAKLQPLCLGAPRSPASNADDGRTEMQPRSTSSLVSTSHRAGSSKGRLWAGRTGADPDGLLGLVGT
jgi:hypothetical protein